MAVKIYELEDLYNIHEQWEDEVGEKYWALWDFFKAEKGWEWDEENSEEFKKLSDLIDGIVSAEASRHLFKERGATMEAKAKKRSQISAIIYDALDALQDEIFDAVDNDLV